MSRSRLATYRTKYPLAMADPTLNGLRTVKDMQNLNEVRLRAELKTVAPRKPQGFPTASETVELSFGTKDFDQAGTWLRKVSVIYNLRVGILVDAHINSPERPLSQLLFLRQSTLIYSSGIHKLADS
jgi:hypothetical protein